jgi:hypothetical protein
MVSRSKKEPETGSWNLSPQALQINATRAAGQSVSTRAWKQ